MFSPVASVAFIGGLPAGADTQDNRSSVRKRPRIDPILPPASNQALLHSRASSLPCWDFTIFMTFHRSPRHSQKRKYAICHRRGGGPVLALLRVVRLFVSIAALGLRRQTRRT